jgi:hypothetical protein
MRFQAEAELDRARRRVREAEDSLTRQMAVVADLQLGAHAELAVLALRLLDNMRTALELQKRHARDIEVRLGR